MSADRHVEDVRDALAGQVLAITEAGLAAIEASVRNANGVDAVSRLASGTAGLGVERVGDAALVQVRGPILELPAFLAALVGSVSVDDVGRAFVAAESSDADRVVISISSPGGSVAGVDELFELIASSAKPVDVFGSGLLASAAYWFAAAGRSITVSPATLVGSVGVVMQAPAAPGGDTIVSRGAPRKLINRSDAQAVVDGTEAIMLEQIATGRGVDVQQARTRFGGGAVFLGANALAAGLVDRVGTLDDVLHSPSTDTPTMHRTDPNAAAPSTTEPDADRDGMSAPEIDSAIAAAFGPSDRTSAAAAPKTNAEVWAERDAADAVARRHA